jgi:hypothetical protein
MHILYVLVHKSACQFVYRRVVDAILRAWKNRGPFFTPTDGEPAIQKSVHTL